MKQTLASGKWRLWPGSGRYLIKLGLDLPGVDHFTLCRLCLQAWFGDSLELVMEVSFCYSSIFTLNFLVLLIFPVSWASLYMFLLEPSLFSPPHIQRKQTSEFSTINGRKWRTLCMRFWKKEEVEINTESWVWTLWGFKSKKKKHPQKVSQQLVKERALKETNLRSLGITFLIYSPTHIPKDFE